MEKKKKKKKKKITNFYSRYIKKIVLFVNMV